MWFVWLNVILTASPFLITSAHEKSYFTPTKTGFPGGVIVQLFEWRFDDIARECEQFLAPKGFAGVQVSPVNENAIIDARPWWERYQPISYKIISRSGNEEQFRNMVERCNKVGVKVYVDVVLNNMAGADERKTILLGVGGSTADPENYYYPDVPYTKDDFNTPTCHISQASYANNATEVRNCEYLGLPDLNQTRPYVREKMVAFLNNLISCGVAGFRVDAAKHMWPSDLRTIFSSVKHLNTAHGFQSQSKPFVYQDVASVGSHEPVSGTDEIIKPWEYYTVGHVEDYRYATKLSAAFKNHNPLRWYFNFGEPWKLVPNKNAVVFIDNHDTQRQDADISDNLTHKQPKLYKMAVAFMLAWAYGTPRIMSSYYFDNKDRGPPSRRDQTVSNVEFINVRGDICINGWVCEHRWRQISNMVKFRNVVGVEPVKFWWFNFNFQAAFSRGNKGFIAFNMENVPLNRTMKTGLPAGEYCDVISGDLDKGPCTGNTTPAPTGEYCDVSSEGMEKGRCTGKTITVNSRGLVTIYLEPHDWNGMVAIHVGARLT